MNCKNCGSHVEGNYCSKCGQNTRVRRIDLSSFINELSETLFQVNRGFFFTYFSLFTKPGQTIRDFLEGKRAQHYKPIAYVLLLSTLYLLVTRITEQATWIDDLVSGFNQYEEGIDIPSQFNWLINNFSYSNLILLPIFSIGSFLAFKKAKYNYLEHMVLNAYITGQQSVIYLLFNLVTFYYDNKLTDAIPTFLSIFYTFWVYWQFFNKGNRVINILSTLLTYVIYVILSSLFLVIASIIGNVIFS